jgi:hypothetical protein
LRHRGRASAQRGNHFAMIGGRQAPACATLRAMSNPHWLPALVALVLACGSGSPSVAPGAPAGDVRELVGEVSAVRNGERRALTRGAWVSGDDVIHTAPDASVVIELRHNGVRWSLGPGKQRTVADSAAWTAARGSSQVAITDERSGAAGRHAEREAAGTSATGAVDDRAAPAAAAPVAAAPAAAAPAADPAMQRQAAAADVTAAPMAAIDPAPAAKALAVARPSELDGAADGAPAIVIEGAPADLRVLDRRGAAVVRACRRKAKGVTGRIEVTIAIDRRGRASDVAVRADAGLEPVADCALPGLRRLRFAKRAAPATLRGPIAID